MLAFPSSPPSVSESPAQIRSGKGRANFPGIFPIPNEKSGHNASEPCLPVPEVLLTASTCPCAPQHACPPALTGARASEARGQQLPARPPRLAPCPRPPATYFQLRFGHFAAFLRVQGREGIPDGFQKLGSQLHDSRVPMTEAARSAGRIRPPASLPASASPAAAQETRRALQAAGR